MENILYATLAVIFVLSLLVSKYTHKNNNEIHGYFFNVIVNFMFISLVVVGLIATYQWLTK